MATAATKSLEQESAVAVSDMNDQFETVAEFEEWLKDQYELTDKRFEFVNGQIIEKAGIKQEELFIADFLTTLFVKTNAYTNGDRLLPEIDSYVDAKRKRIPDIAYFTAAQKKEMRTGKRQAVHFAIEILSESETIGHLERKIQDYFEANGKLVWYISPKQEMIYVYTAPKEVKIYHGEQEISAAPVIENFKFKVKEMFE